MKKITLLFLFAFVLTIGAQNATQRLVVWQKSGEKVYFDLTEEPETTFEGTKTAIDGPKLRPGEIVFRQGADQMAFDGLADGTRIDVYTLNGKLLKSQTARSSQQSVVSLASQPAGTYIVKVGDANSVHKHTCTHVYSSIWCY